MPAHPGVSAGRGLLGSSRNSCVSLIRVSCLELDFAFRYANVELNDFRVICSLASKGLIGQLT